MLTICGFESLSSWVASAMNAFALGGKTCRSCATTASSRLTADWLGEFAVLDRPRGVRYDVIHRELTSFGVFQEDIQVHPQTPSSAQTPSMKHLQALIRIYLSGVFILRSYS